MRRLATITACAALTLGLAACGNDNPAGENDLDHSAMPSTGYAGLCDAIAAAQAGDKEQAVKLFDHGPLHDLAAGVTDIDRALAADLLRAKEQAESDTTDDTVTSSVFATSLTALADVTRQAQTALGDEPMAACTSEEP